MKSYAATVMFHKRTVYPTLGLVLPDGNRNSP
jgi:hypothetical protein